MLLCRLVSPHRQVIAAARGCETKGGHRRKRDMLRGCNTTILLLENRIILRLSFVIDARQPPKLSTRCAGTHFWHMYLLEDAMRGAHHFWGLLYKILNFWPPRKSEVVCLRRVLHLQYLTSIRSNYGTK
jgi:hypothetical protein